MTDHREVMRQALEAIEGDLATYNIPPTSRMLEAIEALRAAIDEPVPEPVAWRVTLDDDVQFVYDERMLPLIDPDLHRTRQPLYAHPPAPPADANLCRTDSRCQYAIDHGAEGIGHCPAGKCVMPAADADTITVRLTREQHDFTVRAVRAHWPARRDLLAILGTFPDAAENGKP